MSSDELLRLREEQFGDVSETDLTQIVVLEDMCLLQDLYLGNDTLDVFRQVVECGDSRRGIRFIRYYAKNDRSKFGQALNHLVKFLIDRQRKIDNITDYRERFLILGVREALENEQILKTTFISMLGFTLEHFPTYGIETLDLPKQLIYSYADSEPARSYWNYEYMNQMFGYQGVNQKSFREWFEFQFQRDLEDVEDLMISDLFLSFYDCLDRVLFWDSEQEILIYDPYNDENSPFSTQVIIGNTCIIIVGIEYDL